MSCLRHDDVLDCNSLNEATVDTDPKAARIAANFALFNHYVEKAEHYYATGNQEAAAITVALAAHLAAGTHCGIFWSPRLEQILISIGRHMPRNRANPPQLSKAMPFKKVLHVGTEVQVSGGLTRMLGRWVDADENQINSIALTQQRGPIPEHLATAIKRCGGRLHYLNQRPGSLMTWAQNLRELAQRHDAVVLHIHCEDVIPLIAFADASQIPPVLVLNHADHLFWLGSSIAHACINLRDAATDLSILRRGIAPERNLLMPTIVDATVRTRTREEAKRLLGFDPERTLMLSVARAAKYRTMDGVTFADMHVDLLKKHSDVELVVVGVGDQEDWKPAIKACGGRIKPLATQSDPRPYYEAADIYVDSYPFVSSTSMMEASSYGLPSVTLFTAPEEARIIGINHVGLVRTAIVAKSKTEYGEALNRLIGDTAYRTSVGEAARLAIADKHTPPNWCARLDEIYEEARCLAPLDSAKMLAQHAPETPFSGEPDRRHEDMFSATFPMAGNLKRYMGMASPRQQLAFWQELKDEGAFRNWREASIYLLPEWLRRNLKDRLRRPET